ncbi:DUF4190 domain-containing protein [Ornithinibacillus scapharcae]|uniref:DUF4190 domain-containing protein n=1 Tax=Ornithinibacillus scapharcae TaxID=1147159 RepID=UPI000225AD52|nr:DUF4190 domain-containing protein [Ornithinibacillus scapharcae]
MVLGILSIVIPWVGFILAIIGLVFANISIKEMTVSGESGRGLAIAGRVISIITLSLYGLLILIIMLIIGISSLSYY